MVRSFVFMAGLLASAIVVSPASAQVYAPAAGVAPGDDPQARSVTIYGPGQLGSDARIPSRIDRSRREMNRGRASTAIMDALPEEPGAIREAAQTAVNRAMKDCRVVDALVLGRDMDHAPVFEAACARGPGYLVVAGTPPRAVECAEAAQGAGHRDRDPDADVINSCQLPGNRMTLEQVAVYARRAGVACDIDEGLVVGRHNAGAILEIGCRDAAGYWVSREDGAWNRTSCLKVSREGECRFTTPEELHKSLTGRLAGTSAAGCQVERARYVGSANQRDYMEAVCQGGGGYMLESSADEVISNTWSCEVAATIAGGCQLPRDTRS